MLYSFDIFDTLITRRTISPKGIFALMQQVLQNDNYNNFTKFLRNNFFTIRVNAETYARCITTEEDITLEDIYYHIAYTSCLNEKEIEILKNLELTLEKQNIIGITENIQLIENLLKLNEKVCLISDMYLSSEQIRTLLTHVNPIFKDIPIFVSSEIKKTKATGNIYPIVKKHYNISYNEWIHTGDNLHSDVEMAKKHNIHGKLYSYVPLEQYEKNLLSQHENNALYQLCLGTSKNCRIDNNEGKYHLGSGIAGTLIFIYVYWILEQAKKLNIKKLYFLSRDGYILKEVADIIIQTNKLNISTKYIYSSRYVWRVCLIDENFDFTSFFGGFLIDGGCTVSNFLISFNLNNNKKFLESLPTKFQNVNHIITHTDKLFLQNYLNNNKLSRRLLLDQIEESKKLLKQYLDQEIDFTKDDFAFVDTFGSGITLEFIAQYLHKFYKSPIRCFYLTQIFVKELDIKHVTFFQMLKHHPNLTHDIVEPLTRAPHGQMLGYEIKNSKVVPILDPTEGKAIIQNGFPWYLQGVKDFTYNFLKVIKEYNLDPISLDLFYFYYLFLLNQPDKKTADLIGSVPFLPNSVNNNNIIYEYAPIKNSHQYIHYSWQNGVLARRNNHFYRNTQDIPEPHNPPLVKPKIKKKKLFTINSSRTQRRLIIILFGYKIKLDKYYKYLIDFYYNHINKK